MDAAGGEGAALVVDHEDPGAVGELVARIERERGRLDVLVNDIFGGDRYMEWDKPLWEHDWEGGLRHLRGECRVPAERRLLLRPGQGQRRANRHRAERRARAAAYHRHGSHAGLASLRVPDLRRARRRRLADAYGFTDTDGSRPDCWGDLARCGWGHADGAGIDDFR